MTTRMTINGVSTCAEAGTEKYERFQSGIGRRRYLLPFIEAIICHTSDKNGDKYISQPYCLIEIS